MEEEGEDQEDKWTREKLDQIQPTNPISTASFSIGPELSQPKPEAPTARAPTPNTRKNITPATRAAHSSTVLGNLGRKRVSELPASSWREWLHGFLTSSPLDPRTRGVLGLAGHVGLVPVHVRRRGDREDRGVVPEGPQGGGQPGASGGGARGRGGGAGVRVVAGGGRPLPSGARVPVVDQPEPAAPGRLAPPARGRKARHAEVSRRRRRAAPAGPRHRRHARLLQSSLRFVSIISAGNLSFFKEKIVIFHRVISRQSYPGFPFFVCSCFKINS